MVIAILGAGPVGAGLGRGWATAGHEIRFAGAKPDSESARAAARGVGPVGTHGTVSEVVDGADVVVLALPFAAVDDVVATLGKDFDGVLVDAVNPLAFADDGTPMLAIDGSAGELLASKLPNARIVKAFNSIGFEHLTDPALSGEPAQIFTCSDDSDARVTVEELISQLGLIPVPLGPLRNARLTESLALTWIWLAHPEGRGRGFALNIVEPHGDEQPAAVASGS